MEDLKKFANFNPKNTDEYKWFWEILEEYDEEMKANFLFFTTGCFKPPHGGF